MTDSCLVTAEADCGALAVPDARTPEQLLNRRPSQPDMFAQRAHEETARRDAERREAEQREVERREVERREVERREVERREVERREMEDLQRREAEQREMERIQMLRAQHEEQERKVTPLPIGPFLFVEDAASVSAHETGSGGRHGPTAVYTSTAGYMPTAVYTELTSIGGAAGRKGSARGSRAETPNGAFTARADRRAEVRGTVLCLHCVCGALRL